jgi:excisionase family DNA binding protein
MSSQLSQEPMTPLMTEREVADLFRVHTRTVRRWSVAGKLDAIRVGGVTRYSADSIADLISPHNDERPAVNGPLGKLRGADAQVPPE